MSGSIRPISAPWGSCTSSATLVLFGDRRRRLAIPALALAAGWLVTAAFRVLVP